MIFELKYHQATFDMLTRQVIDPRPFLAELDETEAHNKEYIVERLSKDDSPFADAAPPFVLSEEYRYWTTVPLYGSQPELSPSKVQMLDTFESKIDKQLPASFREWYSLDIGLSLLHAHGSFMPNSMASLGKTYD